MARRRQNTVDLHTQLVSRIQIATTAYRRYSQNPASTWTERFQEKVSKELLELEKIRDDIITCIDLLPEWQAAFDDLDDFDSQVTAFVQAEKAATTTANLAMSGTDIINNITRNNLLNKQPTFIRNDDAPRFDGNPLSWKRWRMQFDSIVGQNDNISDGRKADLLYHCMPPRFKTVVEVNETNWQNALVEIAQTNESLYNVRQALYTKLAEVPQLHNNSSLDQWRAFLDQLRSLTRLAAEHGPVMLDVIRTKFASLLPVPRYKDFVYYYSHESAYDLVSFVERHINGIEQEFRDRAVDLTLQPKSFPPKHSNIKTPARSTHVNITTTSPTVSEPCVFCHGEHLRCDCPLSISERKNSLRRARKCFGCLNDFQPGHDCGYSCKLCNKRENIVLCQLTRRNSRFSTTSAANLSSHSDSVIKSLNVSSINNEKPVNPTSTNIIDVQPITYAYLAKSSPYKTTPSSVVQKPTYMPTVKVLISSPNEATSEKARLLYDSAAGVSLISERRALQLKLPSSPAAPLSVIPVGGNPYIVVDRVVQFNVKSIQDPKIQSTISAYVMPGVLVGRLPAPSPDLVQLAAQKGIILNDFSDKDRTAEVDVVIGQDNLNDHFLLPKQTNYKLITGVTCFESRFGWVIQGRSGGHAATNQSYVFFTNGILEEDNSSIAPMVPNVKCICQDLSSLLIDPLTESSQDEILRRWNEQFQSQIIYDPTSLRYTVPLPWYGAERPACNYKAAFVQCRALKSRLLKENIYEQYSAVLNDLVTQQFAELCPEQDSFSGYFIPHFPVIKTSSSTTPVRPVFNASSKMAGAKSLNDLVFKGIWDQANLLDILLRWRVYPHVLLADLKQAFLQIFIREEDRRFLKFLWFNADNQIRAYRMRSVLFGATASPFLLYSVLRHALSQPKSRCSPDLLKDVYMDDVLLYSNTLPNLVDLFHRLLTSLQHASFTAHKFTTLPSISESLNIEIKPGIHKSLGVHWDVDSDSIVFPVPTFNESPPTLRLVASYFGKSFDPFGLRGPHQMLLKSFFRDLILDKLNWDDPLTTEQCARLQLYISDMTHLSDLRIPRLTVSSDDYQLWVFGDASRYAYGVCVYTVDIRNQSSKLLVSRGHLASIKSRTIPELEMAAACLAAETSSFVAASLQCHSNRVQLFSDSKITIHRIKSNKKDQSVYVAGRVHKILEQTSPEQWYHIPTNLNPADIISRGALLKQLSNNSKWFDGPPINEIQAIMSENIICAATVFNKPNIDVQSLFSRVLSMPYHLLLRFFSRILPRVIPAEEIIIRHQQSYGSTLSIELIVHIIIWRLIQQQCISEEVNCLQQKQAIPVSSPFFRVPIFLDSEGLVRVDRRLSLSQLEKEIQYPIALKDCPSARNYIKYIHETHSCHAKTKSTLFRVRQCIYMPRDYTVVDQVVRSCLSCNARDGRPFASPISPLPADRVLPGRAFDVVGIDLFGPFIIDKKKKLYGLLFSCSKSRAIHLEAVMSKDTSAILRALVRFAGIYGTPRRIRSDNERSFVKLNKDLKFLYSKLTIALRTFSLQRGIEWIFNVPLAPWWGGQWERLIRTVKSALGRVRLNSAQTYEQLETLFRSVQGCLNSRPLIHYPDNVDVITPSHLLYGRALESLPPVRISKTSQNDALLEYTELQSALDSFWSQWRRIYLPSLRSAVLKPTAAPIVGELVIIHEMAPRYKWRIGRILRLIPGRDKIIRSAEIRLLDDNSLLVRPVQKLVPVERNLAPGICCAESQPQISTSSTDATYAIKGISEI